MHGSPSNIPQVKPDIIVVDGDPEPTRAARSPGTETRETTSTIRPGMQADLVVLAGDPGRTPSDIRNVDTVFRRGIGFDPGKLQASVRRPSV